MASILVLVGRTRPDEPGRPPETERKLTAAETIAEQRLVENDAADRAREAAQHATQLVSEQKAVLEKELEAVREELIKARDLASATALAAERAQRRADDSERRAKRAESDAIAAHEVAARANGELQKVLARERERQALVERTIGSSPIRDLRELNGKPVDTPHN